MAKIEAYKCKSTKSDEGTSTVYLDKDGWWYLEYVKDGVLMQHGGNDWLWILNELRDSMHRRLGIIDKLRLWVATVYRKLTV